MTGHGKKTKKGVHDLDQIDQRLGKKGGRAAARSPKRGITNWTRRELKALSERAYGTGGGV